MGLHSLLLEVALYAAISCWASDRMVESVKDFHHYAACQKVLRRAVREKEERDAAGEVEVE